MGRLRRSVCATLRSLRCATSCHSSPPSYHASTRSRSVKSRRRGCPSPIARARLHPFTATMRPCPARCARARLVVWLSPLAMSNRASPAPSAPAKLGVARVLQRPRHRAASAFTARKRQGVAAAARGAPSRGYRERPDARADLHPVEFAPWRRGCAKVLELAACARAPLRRRTSWRAGGRAQCSAHEMARRHRPAGRSGPSDGRLLCHAQAKFKQWRDVADLRVVLS